LKAKGKLGRGRHALLLWLWTFIIAVCIIDGQLRVKVVVYCDIANY